MKIWLLQNLIPGFYSDFVYLKLKRVVDEYKNKKDKDFILERGKDNNNNIIYEIKNVFEFNKERKHKVEEKSKTILSVVFIGLTILFSIFETDNLAFSSNELVNSQNFSSSLFLLGGLSLVFCGIRAIQVLNVKEFHTFQQFDISKDYCKFTINEKSYDDLLKESIKSNHINEKSILMKTNYSYSAFILLRNAIIFLISSQLFS